VSYPVPWIKPSGRAAEPRDSATPWWWSVVSLDCQLDSVSPEQLYKLVRTGFGFFDHVIVVCHGRKVKCDPDKLHQRFDLHRMHFS
ncbi:MAG: hypothetical protein ACO22U_15305, partial [bacterium]